MDRPTSPARPGSRTLLQVCLAGAASVAVVAGVLAPVAAVAADSPSATPSATPSAAPSATPSGSPTASPSAAAGVGRPVLSGPALIGPVSPLDESQPVLKDIVLTWAPVRGAKGYTVQVSQDGEFADDDVTYTATSTGTRLTLPADLPNAAYRWRVAAVQAAGHGFWSTSGAFTKGWRDRVQDLATDEGPRGDEPPSFSWSPLASASEYELQVSRTPVFDADPQLHQSDSDTVTCYTTRTRVSLFNTQGKSRDDGPGDCFFAFSPGTTNYWRVRALDHVADSAGDVDTTPVVTTGVQTAPLGDTSETLGTGPCGGTAPTPTPSADPSSASPSPSASPQDEGAVGSCTPAHPVEYSAWSAPQTVVYRPTATATPTSDTLLPVPVRALAPEHCTARPPVAGEGASYDCVEFPTLDWDRRPGAVGYRLYVSLDDAFTNIQEIVETPATEWTPTAPWRDTTASQSYHYAVQACTATRCGDVVRTPDSFRKKNPRVLLTAPASGSLFGSEDVTLRWKPFSTTQRALLGSRVAGTSATQEAYAYRVQVAEAPADGRAVTDADFQSTIEDAVVDGALCRPGTGAVAAPRTTTRAVQNCTGVGTVAHDPSLDEVTFTSSTTSYPTGDYVWRVQALDAAGHRLPWSQAGTFRRDVTPPTATLRGTTAVDGQLLARFSEPVTGITGSTLTVSPAAPVVLTVAPDRRSATLRPAGTWVPGQTYTVRLGTGIADAVGNPLAPGQASTTVSGLVDDGSKALSYAGTWAARSASNAFGGGFRVSAPTARAQSAASLTLAGKGVSITGCVGPAGGLADLWVDGTKRLRVDTYRSFSGCGVVLAKIALPAGQHRVQVRGVGLKRAASKGTQVMLDAVRAL